MFIPVTIGSGYTEIDVQVTESGIFRCPTLFVTHRQIQYPLNAEIEVSIGDTVRLGTWITSRETIEVFLNEFRYTWHVATPRPGRQIDAPVHKLLTGNFYGTLHNVTKGTHIPYQQTPTFEIGDAIASIDYVKRDVWFFGNGVKKVSFDSAIVATVFMPRWSQLEGITTECFVVCVDKVHRLGDLYDIEETFTVSPGVVAASGDTGRTLVLCYPDRIVLWENGEIQMTLSSPLLLNIHSIFIAPDNTMVVGTENGIVMVFNIGGEWNFDMLYSGRGLFLSFDISDTFLYVIDQFNKQLLRIRTGDRVLSRVGYDEVPKEVVFNEETEEVYVFFFDLTTIRVYNESLIEQDSLTGLKCHGALVDDGDIIVTNLYMDGQTLTSPLSVHPTDFVEGLNNIRTDIVEPSTRRYTITWQRSEFVTFRSNVPGTEALLNGILFEEGYVRAGDEFTFNVPYNSRYYSTTFATLVGHRSVSVWFRVEPKRYPDLEVVPEVLEAFPRYEYFHTYTIKGITEGFTATMMYEGTEMLIRKAGTTTYTPSLTVSNGDVIEVRAAIRNLLSKRTPHEYTSYRGNVVLTWTLLPMTLNGTTVRKETEKPVYKFAHRYVQEILEVAQKAEDVRKARIVELTNNAEQLLQHIHLVQEQLGIPTTCPTNTQSLNHHIIMQHIHDGSYEQQAIRELSVIKEFDGYDHLIESTQFNFALLNIGDVGQYNLWQGSTSGEFFGIQYGDSYALDSVPFSSMIFGDPYAVTADIEKSPRGSIQSIYPYYQKESGNVEIYDTEAVKVLRNWQSTDYDAITTLTRFQEIANDYESLHTNWQATERDVDRGTDQAVYGIDITVSMVKHSIGVWIQGPLKEFIFYDIIPSAPSTLTRDNWRPYVGVEREDWSFGSDARDTSSFVTYEIEGGELGEYYGRYYVLAMYEAFLTKAVYEIAAEYDLANNHQEVFESLAELKRNHQEYTSVDFERIIRRFEEISPIYRRTVAHIELSPEVQYDFVRSSYGSIIDTPEITGMGGESYANDYADYLAVSTLRRRIQEHNGKVWFTSEPNMDIIFCEIDSVPPTSRTRYGFHGGG